MCINLPVELLFFVFRKVKSLEIQLFDFFLSLFSKVIGSIMFTNMVNHKDSNGTTDFFVFVFVFKTQNKL